jgi:hypothetical protein
MTRGIFAACHVRPTRRLSQASSTSLCRRTRASRRPGRRRANGDRHTSWRNEAHVRPLGRADRRVLRRRRRQPAWRRRRSGDPGVQSCLTAGDDRPRSSSPPVADRS